MASFSIDLSALLQLESAVASLQAQPPSTYVGQAPFAVTYKVGAPGAPPTMTTQQLVARLQTLLLAVQNLPQ